MLIYDPVRNPTLNHVQGHKRSAVTFFNPLETRPFIYVLRNETETLTAGIHAPPGPRTARCELVRDLSGFFGPGAVRSDFLKKFSMRCGAVRYY